MAKSKKNDYKRYKQNERIWIYGLLADAGIFLLYLLMAGVGAVFMKWFLAVLAILVSAAGIGTLYLTGEWRRQRSLYLTAGFGAVALVILFSLILNYPSPNELANAIIDEAGKIIYK